MNTVLEWSLEFDQMYNNITSNQAPGLTEHEKSIFLTRAQEALVKDYFSGKTNVLGEGFDDSERRQADFSTLVSVQTLVDVSSDVGVPRLDLRGISKVYEFPDNILLTLNEQLQYSYTENTQTKYKYFQIVPISYEEYRRLMLKPYKFPPKGMAWRLMTGSLSDSETYVQRIEVIASPSLPSSGLTYVMRYVRRPEPIILPDIQGDDETDDAELSVNGSNAISPCLLPEHLHDEILQRAVLLAKIAWSDAVAPQGQTNQR